MPGQILPLRILTNSIPSFSTMKLTPNIHSSRLGSNGGISVFSKVFPFKLKYLGLPQNGIGVRRYSTSGSFRGRNEVGSSRSNEFTRSRGGGRRGGDRGGFRGGSFGGRVGQAKSLIDDEDDLNEWVSGLKTDSIKFSSDSDDGGSGRHVNRDFDSGRGGRDFNSGRGGRGRDFDSGRGSRGRDSGPMRGQRGGTDGFAASKRPRESDSDDFDFSDGRSSRGGRGRRGSDSFSRGSRGTMSRRGSDSDDFDMSDRRSSRGGRGGRGSDSFSRGSRGSMSRRGSDSDDFSMSDRFDRRGGRGMGGPSSRGSRGSMTNSRRRDFDEDVDYPPRRRENGSRDAVSSFPKRGGRDSDMSFAQRRDGDTIQKGKKQALLTSDEDEDDDDDLDSSFGQLLSDVDSDEDEDEEEELPLKRKGKGVRDELTDVKSRVNGKKKVFESSEDEDDEDEGETPIRGFEDFLNGDDSDEDLEKDALKVMDASSLSGPAKRDSTHSLPKTSSTDAESYLSGTRFDECAISPLSLKGIKDAGYEKMTVVQEATLPIILKGKDVLAKARTGTGKTVAFLLPAIEVVVKSPPVDRDQKRPPINVLVICPTRELASQATAEATKLLKYHPSIGVQTVIGGVRLALEQKRMQANPCQILVATPGRLKDHIENTAGFATRLMGVKVLVLDEADHLLDMGFRKDIEKIISAVPKQRQTLLFSATVPDDVRQICHVALKRDHEYINTVVEGSGETHAQVRQTHLVAPLDKQFSLLYALLKDHIADDIDYKVLVFCTTAMVTKLVADLLSELKLNVREIHSRKPQSYRTRVSDEFRKSKGLILVTSDVSARGVDYPDVTLVIQVGLPADREQYIHRLGRTGRKGKEGQGVLMLAPWEESFLSSVKDLPISKAPVPSVDPDTRKKVERALSNVEMKNKESAYQAWLGYYNSTRIVGKDKCRLVELANEFSRSMGLDNPPAIPKLILGKMGLRNVPGLRVK